MIKQKLNLPRTWLIDLDGTIVEHNGYLKSGDRLLDGVFEFWAKIPNDDVIIILTARNSSYREETEFFLKDKMIRYNYLLMDLPTGARFLINDRKPDGSTTSYSLNVDRNCGLTSALDLV